MLKLQLFVNYYTKISRCYSYQLNLSLITFAGFIASGIWTVHDCKLVWDGDVQFISLLREKFQFKCKQFRQPELATASVCLWKCFVVNLRKSQQKEMKEVSENKDDSMGRSHSPPPPPHHHLLYNRSYDSGMDCDSSLLCTETNCSICSFLLKSILKSAHKIKSMCPLFIYGFIVKLIQQT